MGSIFSELCFFVVCIEPSFPKTLQRFYDLAFSKLAQIFAEKQIFGFLEG